MGKLVIFVLGLATGVAVMFAFYDRVDDSEKVAESYTESRAETRSVVESTEPLAPREAQPVVAQVRPEPPPPPLDEALAEANGDVESLIFDGDTFIGGRAAQLLAGDEFSRLVSALSRSPSVSAPENYQKLFDELHQMPIVLSGAVMVQTLACGRRVCAANLVGYDAASVDQAWTEITGGRRGGMMYGSNGIEIAMRDVVIGSIQTQGMNGFERRMLITVDPSVRGITSGFVVFDHARLPGDG